MERNNNSTSARNKNVVSCSEEKKFEYTHTHIQPENKNCTRFFHCSSRMKKKIETSMSGSVNF